jgi:hypothetical protein
MARDVAKRSAEFKLFLAFEADRLGVEPAALSKVAEPLSAKAFRAAPWPALFLALRIPSPN